MTKYSSVSSLLEYKVNPDGVSINPRNPPKTAPALPLYSNSTLLLFYKLLYMYHSFPIVSITTDLTTLPPTVLAQKCPSVIKVFP